MLSLIQVMSKDVKMVNAQESIMEAASKMRDERVGSLLVKKNGEPVGIVTERDLVRKAVAQNLDCAKTSIESIMTTPFHSLEDTNTILDAHHIMKLRGVRYLLVQKNGRVVGIVSIADLLGYFTLSTSSISQH